MSLHFGCHRATAGHCSLLVLSSDESAGQNMSQPDQETGKTSGQHSLNLDENILWQPRDLDAAPCGLGLAEELGVNLVNRDKVVHVLNEDGSLEDVRGRRV